jgi:DNA processing protein
MSEWNARLRLASASEPGDVEIGRLLQTNSAEELLSTPARLPPRIQNRIPKSDVVLRDLKLSGATFITHQDSAWPVMLNHLGALAPIGLWIRGNIECLNSFSISMVGARSSTMYGEEVASDMAAQLAAQDVVIVSGGAFGIDAASHRGALSVSGQTIAILAGGVSKPYPLSNSSMFQRIVNSGALVSEVPPDAVPMKHRFLIRNRLIAAWSQGTVVVEARARSGAIASASHAIALGRDVMAVPGQVNSAASVGCHHLIRDGAVLVTSAADVLELTRGDLLRH